MKHTNKKALKAAKILLLAGVDKLNSKDIKVAGKLFSDPQVNKVSLVAAMRAIVAQETAVLLRGAMR